MTRKPAVAMVTAGPGFTNALSGIASARLSNAPVVLIAGCVGLETAEKLDLQDMTQLPVISPMVKKALVCHNAERIPEFIDMAFRYAIQGRPGPVYLELPCDMLNATPDMSKVKKYRSTVTSRAVDCGSAGKDHRHAVGRRKSRSSSREAAPGIPTPAPELVAFVEKTGIPAFTLGGGRGVIPDTHPLCFESSLAIRPGASLVANMTGRPGALPGIAAFPFLHIRRHLPRRPRSSSRWTSRPRRSAATAPWTWAW